MGQGEDRRLFLRLIGSFDPLCCSIVFVKGNGFPEHQHRGFEAVTYMIDGAFRHKDTWETIQIGRGAQRFSAGRYCALEMPGSDEGCHGSALTISLYTLKGANRISAGNPEQIKTEVNGMEIRTILGGNSPVKHFHRSI